MYQDMSTFTKIVKIDNFQYYTRANTLAYNRQTYVVQHSRWAEGFAGQSLISEEALFIYRLVNFRKHTFPTDI